MNEREYDRLKKLVEREYRKKLEALEVVWRMAREAQAQAPRPPRHLSSNGSRRPIGAGIATAIAAALPRLGHEFTVKDVEPLIRAPGSEPIDRSSISHALKRLAASNLVEVIRIGRGKRPTLYKLAAISQSVETATEELAQKIRVLASSLKLNKDEFKNKYMRGHGKLMEMPLSEAQALLVELKSMAEAAE